MSGEDLSELEARIRGGESATAEETLDLIQRVRKLEWDLDGMDRLYNTLSDQARALRSHVSGLRNRLGYVRLQLQKEAKFLHRWKPENNRFYRAYDTLSEIIDQI